MLIPSAIFFLIYNSRFSGSSGVEPDKTLLPIAMPQELPAAVRL